MESNETLDSPPPDSGWIVAGRPGFAGFGRAKLNQRFDRLYGAGNWRIGHLWHGQVLQRDAALTLYEEAYYQYLRSHPDVLDWLCATASEVYDIEPSNVASGLDYYQQESKATHLQDIALRRCLQRLGRTFQGDHLVQVRGHNSEGYHLNPGQVPFHEPQGILQPSLAEGTWWDAGSIEDFWQSNKVLQLRDSLAEPVLRQHFLRDLAPQGDGPSAVAIFGGSFNPIHHGHLRIAQDLLDLYGFARVIFVPNGNGYRKKDLIDERHRAALVQLAIAGEPRFEMCSHELNCSQVRYTDETVRLLREQLATTGQDVQLYLLRGSDVVQRMLGWRNLPELLRCIIVVPIRPGSDPWEEFGRDERFRLHCDRFRLLQRDYEDGLSSSLVRSRLRQGGSARYLVPDPVRQYIEEHQLYR